MSKTIDYLKSNESRMEEPMKRNSRMVRRAGLMTVVGALLFVPPAAIAQTSASDSPDIEAVRGYVMDALERSKTWDMSIALAIPDSALRWAPNPDVRDFAEQVEHGANNLFIAGSLFGGEPPAFGDSEVILNDKQALSEAVGRAYDWLIEHLPELSDEAWAESVPFFGGQMMPRWRICVFALEHAMWTRGQLVPYFHAHGVPVPQQRLF